MKILSKAVRALVGLLGFCLVGCSSGYPALNAFCVIECEVPVNGEWTAAHHDTPNSLRTDAAVQFEADMLIKPALSQDMTGLYKRANAGTAADSAIFGLALLAGRSSAHINDNAFVMTQPQSGDSRYWLQRAQDGVETPPSTTSIYVPSPRLGGAGSTQLVTMPGGHTVLPLDTYSSFFLASVICAQLW